MYVINLHIMIEYKSISKQILMTLNFILITWEGFTEFTEM